MSIDFNEVRKFIESEANCSKCKFAYDIGRNCFCCFNPNSIQNGQYTSAETVCIHFEPGENIKPEIDES